MTSSMSKTAGERVMETVYLAEISPNRFTGLKAEDEPPGDQSTKMKLWVNVPSSSFSVTTVPRAPV